MPPRVSKRVNRSTDHSADSADGRPSSNKRVRVNRDSPIPSSDRFIRTSPRKALEIAASQATHEAPFESQLLSLLPDTTIDLPPEGSRAATEANTGDLDSRFTDKYDGLDWAYIPQYMKPLRTLKGKKSWVFEHGYRVALISDPKKTFWICRYCYKSRKLEGKQALEVTLSTTTVITHMAQNRDGHRLNRQGQLASITLPRGQTSLRFLNDRGVVVSQKVANEIGNFDVQGF
jgi:hypothetical protein